MRVLTFALTFALMLLAECAPEGERRARSDNAAQTAGDLAADREQARLWQEAAARGATNGIERVRPAGNSVQDRERVPAGGQSMAARPETLPQGVAVAARVVTTPEPDESRRGERSTRLMTGGMRAADAARVRSTLGERIEIDLGERGTLAVLARARGGPLRTRAGEAAQVDYRVREDPRDRQSILAMRFEGGDGLVTALETGPQPVSVRIPIFDLVATQVGEPQSGTMSVEVRVGGSRQILSPGQVFEFKEKGLTVGVVSSTAYVGADAYRVEGNPYGINLVAWPAGKL